VRILPVTADQFVQTDWLILVVKCTHNILMLVLQGMSRIFIEVSQASTANDLDFLTLIRASEAAAYRSIAYLILFMSRGVVNSNVTSSANACTAFVIVRLPTRIPVNVFART
jgi:hypothetical protein